MREIETARNIRAARAPRTRTAYAAAWTAFVAYLDGAGALPADPDAVADYLSYLGRDHRPATVRVHASAIAAMHREAGLANPVDSARVRAVLAGHARRFGRAQAQAAPLDQAAFDRIAETALIPRRTRGGRVETVDEAERRALLDVATIGLMRDAMLRRSEAAALTWTDFNLENDGSGTIRIRRSKTDQEAEGATRYVAPETVEVLECLRVVREDAPNAPIIGLSPSQICRRIAGAAQAAGLDGAFSGHSPRVGMAVDLARAGISMPLILEAGRWSSPRTAMRYVEAVCASRGAVAAWYAQQPDDECGNA